MHRATLAFGLLLALCADAAAHPLDLGYARIEAEGQTVSLELELDAKGAAELLGLKDQAAADAMHPAEVNAKAAALARATYLQAPLSTDRGNCTFAGAHARRMQDTIRLSDRATCPEGSAVVRWSFPFMTGAGVTSTFQMLIKAQVFGAEHVATLDRKTVDFEFGGRASLPFGSFVWMGVEHIGAAPSEWQGEGGLKLPDGIDHILFLLALILGGGSLMKLAGVATGFTVGHSITLALATLGIVRLPSALVESVIALSIALVAVEAYFGKFKEHRWKMATGFGLIHGFGFANALTELNLEGGTMMKALFGYNLGVELGQVALVLLVAPLLLLVQNKQPRWNPMMIRATAAVIFVAGGYWFIERALGA